MSSIQRHYSRVISRNFKFGGYRQMFGGCKHVPYSNLHEKTLKNRKNYTELGGGERGVSSLNWAVFTKKLGSGNKKTRNICVPSVSGGLRASYCGVCHEVHDCIHVWTSTCVEKCTQYCKPLPRGHLISLYHDIKNSNISFSYLTYFLNILIENVLDFCVGYVYHKTYTDRAHHCFSNSISKKTPQDTMLLIKKNHTLLTF